MFLATGKLNEVRHTRPTEAARESLNFALNQVKTARRGLQQQTTNTQPANGGIDKTTICHLTELKNAGNNNKAEKVVKKRAEVLWWENSFDSLTFHAVWVFYSVRNFAHTRYVALRE